MQHFSLRAMFCCCSLSWGAFFFCADCRFCGFPLFSLWKITFGKVAPAYACYFFYTTFSLGRLRFPRKNWERDCRFCGFPLLSLWKITFGKVAPAYACYFFYAILSLGKLRFPRIKLHKKSKTPTGFYFSEKIYAEREGSGHNRNYLQISINCQWNYRRVAF